MKRLALFLCLALFSPSARADTYPRQPGLDVVHYVFRIGLLTDDSNEIHGEATVTVRFLADGVNTLVLDLASAKDGKGMTVASVSSGGVPAGFRHEADRLRIDLAGPSKAGQQASFTIRYDGVPGNGLRLIPNIHGERTAFSENWPDRARQWLPTIDHPYDKATGEFIVTTRSEYQVVANGALVEEADLGNGLRRTHYRQAAPIASWLYAIGVARFTVRHLGLVRGVPLESWVFAQDMEKGVPALEADARNSLEFFSDRVGPYSYEKLAQVEAAGMSGGTEHASAIFYGEKGVAAGRAPVVHEIAHQWFGDSVTERDWDDVWLSEGFATYFTLLFTEHARGRDAFVEGLKKSRASVLELEQKLPDTPVIHRNLSDMRRVVSQLVYQKGGWTLHMLRGLVGDDAFWNGCRDYYRRFQNLNASTDEFREVMERASGKELSGFFSQWLRRSGVPRIEGAWRWDGASRRVEVTLAQTQAQEPFRLRIEVGVVPAAGGLPRVERCELDGRRTVFSFAADSEPASLVLDPGTWLLAEIGSLTRVP